MSMFENKNAVLYDADDTLKAVEPSSLTEFGQNVSDNLTVLGNRISSIMSGSSDDSWDDKVKTQINSAIEKIGNAVKEEQKTAEVIKGASGILSNLKTALEEYVLGYDSWETHLDSKPREETESYTKDDGTQGTRYTQSYLDKKAAWDKEDAILKKTVPELEEQAETWMEQVKNYFTAYNFETHEINTTIYKENKDPLKFYGDLYKQYEGEYVPQEEEENVVPAETETQPVEETTEHGTIAEKKDEGPSIIEGTRRLLSEEEQSRFYESPYENNGFGFRIKDDAGIEIYESQVTINNVTFTTYEVMYPGIDEEAYARNRQNEIDYLSSLPSNVLEYTRDGGTDLVFLSSGLCTKDSYLENGNILNGPTNYCHGGTRDVVVLCDFPEWQNDYQGNALIHEFGHATDKTIHVNELLATGNYSLSEDGVLIDNSDNSWSDTVGCITATSDTEQANEFKTAFAGAYPDLYPGSDPIQDTDFGWQEYAAEAFKWYYSPDYRDNTSQIAPDLCKWMNKYIDSL